jgi:hypothetical protein
VDSCQNAPDHIGTSLIATEAMYLAVFDRLSPANRLRIQEEAWDLAAQRAGDEKWQTLLYFNGYWRDRADARELLAWTLLHDGVFRIRIEASNVPFVTEPVEGKEDRFVGQDGGKGFLACPSGEIIVDSLSRLGEVDLCSTVIVPPGLYQVWLTCDCDQVNEHSFLERLDEYPEADGPDWILYLMQQGS